MFFAAVKMATSLRSLAYGTPETLKELTMLRAFLQGRRQTVPVPVYQLWAMEKNHRTHSFKTLRHSGCSNYGIFVAKKKCQMELPSELMHVS